MRFLPDDRLSMSVEHASGRTTRWGPEEVDGENIPNDLTFGTTMPGGNGAGSCSLLRRLDQTHQDQDLFDLVTVHGPGGRIAHQGFAAQFPRSHGDAFAITPGWVGASASLRWDPSFREIYADRDPGSFGEALLARKLDHAASGISQGDLTWQNESGALVLTYPSTAANLSAQTVGEIAYAMPAGCKVATFYYRGAQTSFPGGYIIRFNASDLEALTGGELYTPTLDDTLRSQALSTARRRLSLYVYSNGTAATPAAGALTRMTKIGVYGNHGLTLRTITGDAPGVYASDVVTDVVTRAAPLLSTAGIEATTFAIPHLVYRDPVTAEFVVSDANKYHLYDWGVYDNLEFFYRQPNPDRLCWEARLGDGAHMDADGLTGEQVYNGVIVTYTEAGVQKTVGPPSGTAGTFDATDAALADTSVENPVNSHGIPAKPLPLTLSFPSTLAGATQIGAVALAEGSLNPYRGTLTLTGTVQHPTEGKVPVWRVRAGDWIRVTDLNGENASVQRKIIETSYSHSSRSVRLSLDRTPAKLSAILERVGIQAGIATGGGF